MPKPKTIAQYSEWAAVHLGSNFEDPKIRRIYEVNLNTCFNIVSKHQFFLDLQTQLEKWEQEYQALTITELFMDASPPELVLKPYESAIDKSFRVNVLWNENFPNPPKKGWVTADNLYYCFNDLIRCSIVCRFIDGPRFVTDKLMDFAKSLTLERRRYSQERDEGYYAFHYYVKFPVRLLNSNWDELESNIEVEIQVTTQLQDVLRNLTHNFYKANRILPEQDSSKWKWDFKSNRFRVGYLSHTLHLLESIILESRDEMAEQFKRGNTPDETNDK
jgi:ppGpp synthetase/RelA/SpoT-type nucleotidyltranferase